MAIEAGGLTLDFDWIYPILLSAFFTSYNHISNCPTQKPV
jgi:hypothetical protein